MKKPRILIVDDEVGSSQLLKINLEETGRFEARVENWAEDALPAAREFKPDLMLLDVLMPRVFGGDVAAAFRADPELQTMPIILLTATVHKSRVIEHAGVIDGMPIIAKPATVEEIIQRIEENLRKPGGADSPPPPDPAGPNPNPS